LSHLRLVDPGDDPLKSTGGERPGNVNRCTDEGVWPTSVAHDTDDRLTIAVGDKTFAVIRPVSSPLPIDERLRSRAESTILGLEKADNLQQELVRRIRKWPGPRMCP